jgi:cell division protein FtsW
VAQKVKTDWILFSAVVCLVAFGLLMLYSASSIMAQVRYGSSYHFALRQAGWAVGALGAMMYLKAKDYRSFNAPMYAFASVAVVLALLILVYFLDPRAHRWLRLGSLNLQPSEFAKPALVLFLAYFVTRRASAINERHTLMCAALAVGLMTGLVIIADLGTAVVLAITSAAVFFVAGLDWRRIMLAGAVLMLLVTAAIVSKPYRVVRLFGHFDPDYRLLDMRLVKTLDPQGKIKDWLARASATRDPDYHIRQSLIAVGSGGVLGLGPMQGKQKLFYLPEAHTDFIYAVVAEELGLWGALVVIGAFVIILWRGLRLYSRAPDDFGKYIALGVTITVVAQALMNMSVVIGIAPTKGIPLPMISYGGSSLLSTLILLGMLQSVGEHSG